MATTLRLAMELETRAKGYASSIGVPLSALIAIALKDYLDSRGFGPDLLADIDTEEAFAAGREFAGVVARPGRGDRGRKKRRK